MELTRRDFSITIPEARKVEEKSYTSWISGSGYIVFVINTKTNLPNYRTEKEVHIVERRFSDFEYMLSKILENPDYKNYVLPKLPDKGYGRNFEESFIEKRRTDLEAFLRNLMEKDNRVKAD